MRPQSLRAMRHFMRVYIHAQTAVDAGDICTWRTMVIWLREKPEDPQFEPHAGIKMPQVLGSPVYIYELVRAIWMCSCTIYLDAVKHDT